MEVVVAEENPPPPGPPLSTPEPEWLASGEYVCVPVREVPEGAEALVELRTLTDGRLALPGYGSATSLVRCCGDAQPYGVFPGVGRRRDLHRERRRRGRSGPAVAARGVQDRVVTGASS